MATVRLIRHATLLVEFGGRRFLVDPMLGAKGSLDPAAQSGDERRNPLVDLPVPLEELLDYEEILLTHAHRDHFDGAAQQHLPKERPILCQPPDVAKLQAAGFQTVIAVPKEVHRGEIVVARTDGEHGRGEMIAKMGASSGFVLSHPAEPPLFLAGDTVNGPALQAALKVHRPGALVLNAGAAQFVRGGPVTMDAEDVVAIARQCSLAQVVVVHLEAWNHCPLTRKELRARLEDHGLADRVHVPEDGESVNLD
jgi:L-ascorbate metabolism protein UlaG (beta-lactamase superfamily)